MNKVLEPACKAEERIALLDTIHAQRKEIAILEEKLYRARRRSKGRLRHLRGLMSKNEELRDLIKGAMQ
jgi:hypothetical protein